MAASFSICVLVSDLYICLSNHMHEYCLSLGLWLGLFLLLKLFSPSAICMKCRTVNSKMSLCHFHVSLSACALYVPLSLSSMCLNLLVTVFFLRLSLGLTTCLHLTLLILVILSISLSVSARLDFLCLFLCLHSVEFIFSLCLSLIVSAQPLYEISCPLLSQDNFLSTAAGARRKDKGGEEQLLISKDGSEG